MKMRLRLVGSHWTWRVIFCLPYALLLYPLVVRNYRARMAKDAPDTWYWADERLFALGWFVESASAPGADPRRSR
jgi:hypothetical protein